ncbi:MAG: hypothetical protein DRH26_18330, partial [Deltaproteobacteria bacterium]
VRKKYSIPEPQKDDEILRPKNAQISTPIQSKLPLVPKIVEKARNENLDILDMVLNRLGGEADTHIQNMLKPIEKIMAASTSLNDLKANLVDAYSDMNSDDLGELVAKAMAAADLMGRYEVNEDA